MTTMSQCISKSSNLSAGQEVQERDVGSKHKSPKKTCVPSLSKLQWTQLALLTSCFTLAFSSVTLVMSEAPLVVRGTGGSTSLAPISIAMFEIGKSFVVLPVGPLVIRYGRKNVFFFGGFFGFLSSIMGILGVLYSIPYLILLSTFFAGTCTGIAYGFRFAAIEVSPQDKEFALTMCLSGGILAAIIGPVSAEASKDLFEQKFTGPYVVNFLFVAANMILVAFLKFPEAKQETKGVSTRANVAMKSTSIHTEAFTDTDVADNEVLHDEEQAVDAEDEPSRPLKVRDVICNQIFVYACLFSTMTWVCMSLPLSVVGLAMEEVEPPISDQHRSLAFVAHFLGMFLPGLGTGRLIQLLGVYGVGLVAVSTFSVGSLLNLFAQPGEPTLWIIGQLLVGAAWNFGFSAATVMLSTSFPPDQKKHAAIAQSYNDFISFLGGGIITISAGYIYSTRDNGGLGGWRLLNAVQYLFIGIMLVVVLAAWCSGRRSNKENSFCDKEPPSPSCTLATDSSLEGDTMHFANQS